MRDSLHHPLPQLVFLFFPVTWIGEQKRKKKKKRNETKRIVTFSRAQPLPHPSVVWCLLCLLHIVHNNIHTWGIENITQRTFCPSVRVHSPAKEDYCFPPSLLVVRSTARLINNTHDVRGVIVGCLLYCTVASLGCFGGVLDRESSVTEGNPQGNWQAGREIADTTRRRR